MVTPEEIARAMAVHSVEDEPRRGRDDDEARQVLVDETTVQPARNDGEQLPD